ncbi:MAG: hypothetical protein GF350_00900 [Chitinivibrionales bacterium]|nr:hypothetical protein [Chitinivibrionales bacterium]
MKKKRKTGRNDGFLHFLPAGKLFPEDISGYFPIAAMWLGSMGVPGDNLMPAGISTGSLASIFLRLADTLMPKFLRHNRSLWQ